MINNTASQEMEQAELFALMQGVSLHCLRGEPYRGFKAFWCGDEHDKSLKFRNGQGVEIRVVGGCSVEWRVDAWREAKALIDSQA